MKVERYVSKKVLWLIAVALIIGGGATLYFGTIHRFTYASEYENYSEVNGRVKSIQEYEHEKDDDGIYYTYSAEIEYTVDGTSYTKNTDDIFSEDNVPNKGNKIPILYNNNNPNNCVVAKEDWMTKSMVPFTDSGDDWLFTSLLALGMALVVIAMALDSDQVRGVILGFGLLLIGIAGVVMGVITGNSAMFILIIFGALGVLILCRYLFVPKERREREDAAAESLRILKVMNICAEPLNQRNIILFAMMENNGNIVQLLSYDDYNYRFTDGDIFQISKNDVVGFSQVRQVNGYNTIDISQIDGNAIRPINPMLKKVLSHL